MVVEKKSCNEVEFRKIKRGEIFTTRSGGKYFMRTPMCIHDEEYEGDMVNAISIEDGDMTCFSEDKIVIPIRGKFCEM